MEIKNAFTLVSTILFPIASIILVAILLAWSNNIDANHAAKKLSVNESAKLISGNLSTDMDANQQIIKVVCTNYFGEKEPALFIFEDIRGRMFSHNFANLLWSSYPTFELFNQQIIVKSKN